MVRKGSRVQVSKAAPYFDCLDALPDVYLFTDRKFYVIISKSWRLPRFAPLIGGRMESHSGRTFNENEYYDSIKKLVVGLWDRWRYVGQLNSLLSTFLFRSNRYEKECNLKSITISESILGCIALVQSVQKDANEMADMKDAIWRNDVEGLMQLADVAHQLRKDCSALVRSFKDETLANSYESLNREVGFRPRYVEECGNQINLIDKVFRELERKKCESPESFNKAVSYACYCITADDIPIRGQMNETSYRRMFGSTAYPATTFC